jgi:Na+/H+-dicarboxylate symporter
MLDRLKNVPLAVQILVGLAIGAIAGLLLPIAGTNAQVDDTVAALSLGGRLWLQALQMTILPLVFALLSTLFIRSAGLSGGSRATRRAFTMIIGLYLLAVPLGIAVTLTLLNLFPVTDAMAQAMRVMAGEGVVAEPPDWSEAFLALVPTNIVAAMGSGMLLPVLFFSLLFGAALARLEDGEPKRIMAAGLTGLADTIFIIVGWVLRLAPIGVALLILPTVQQNGLDIFAGLAHYISLAVTQVLVFILAIYLVAILVGRIPPLRFARAIAPVQGVAFGTQSSTGCMPLTIKAAREMGVSREASDAAVPLAAVMFRMIAPASAIYISAYSAAVYGLDPVAVGLLVTVGLLGILLEIGSVGIPSTATFVAFYGPIAAVVGIPLEFIVVLLVVETIPDIFKTVLHVTAHATTATVVDRGLDRSGAAAERSA